MSRTSQTDHDEESLGGWQPVGEAVFWVAVFLGLTLVAFSLGEGAGRRTDLAKKTSDAEKITDGTDNELDQHDTPTNDLFKKRIDEPTSDQPRYDSTKTVNARIERTPTEPAKQAPPVPQLLPTKRLDWKQLTKSPTIVKPPKVVETPVENLPTHRLDYQALAKKVVMTPATQRLEVASLQRTAVLTPPSQRLPHETLVQKALLVPASRLLAWREFFKSATLVPATTRLDTNSLVKVAKLTPRSTRTDFASMTHWVELVPRSHRLYWERLLREVTLIPPTTRLDIASLYRAAKLEPGYHALDTQAMTKTARLAPTLVVERAIPPLATPVKANAQPLKTASELKPTPKKSPVALELRPVPGSRKVGEALLVIARVVGENKQPLADQLVEWTLDRQGAGQILRLPEQEDMGRPSEKLLPTYAKTYTAGSPHKLDSAWGHAEIQIGETWCVVESPSAGTMHLTVRAPSVTKSQAGQANALIHWDRATAQFPENTIAQAGTSTQLGARVLASDHGTGMPLPEYRVRYTLEEPNGARFAGHDGTSIEIPSGYDGLAPFVLVQDQPKPGISQGKIELLGRHPLSGHSTPVLCTGTFRVEWKEPAATLAINGPAVAPTETWVKIAVAGSVGNPRLIKNLRLVAIPPADLEIQSSVRGEARDLGPWPGADGRAVELSVRGRNPTAKSIRFELRQGDHVWSTAEHSIRFAAGQIEMRLNVPQPNRKGSEFPVTVHVHNKGLAAVEAVDVRLNIPVGFDLAEAQRGRRSGNMALWTIETLEPGATRSLTCSVVPRTATTGVFHASAMGRNMSEPIETRSDTHIEGIPSLLATVHDSSDPIEVGGEFDYNITVENQGSSAARNVAVEILAPAGLELIKATGSLRTVIAQGKIDIKPIELLEAGAKHTAQVRVRAREKGESRLIVRLRHDSLPSQLMEQHESTIVFAPN